MTTQAKTAQIFLGRDKEEDFLIGGIPMPDYMLNQYSIILPKNSITDYGSKPKSVAEDFAKKMKEQNVLDYLIINGKQLISRETIINSNYPITQEHFEIFKKTLEAKLKGEKK